MLLSAPRVERAKHELQRECSKGVICRALRGTRGRACVRIALVVPGGVDRSGEYRVIPALLALIARLARAHDLQVFALAQEERPDSWELGGARVHNIGRGSTRWHALRTIFAEHRRAPFDVV